MDAQEKIYSIDINLNRSMVFLIIIAITLIVALGYFTMQYQRAHASALQAISSRSDLRKFYLTRFVVDGNEADNTGVCATGYHFASLWEIRDPSRLEYNSDLGLDWEWILGLQSDMGKGPLTFVPGWIRTGYSSSGGLNTWGKDNCFSWSSNSLYFKGSVIALLHEWTLAGNTFGWFGNLYSCNEEYSIWCVED